MPCDQIRLMKVTFKGENKEILELAMEELGFTKTPIIGKETVFLHDEKRYQVTVTQNQSNQLVLTIPQNRYDASRYVTAQEIAQAYSTEVIKQTAAEFGVDLSFDQGSNLTGEIEMQGFL